ncbi:hypothetical protein E2K93_08910 [Thalassotalea sp. HSM 43]|uniref:hypothetical protein n=1 Tax=Thalassotalea sp. HSM 43 TaxID=2552945 RepID=UPI00108125AD|nr:hypothetical protein [Thalassotalea sp. HSM 43]QBY04501.1 hypothetical protein E2K93_08910 [Thalassotalea sp. HSM 43]
MPRKPKFPLSYSHLLAALVCCTMVACGGDRANKNSQELNLSSKVTLEVEFKFIQTELDAATEQKTATSLQINLFMEDETNTRIRVGPADELNLTLNDTDYNLRGYYVEDSSIVFGSSPGFYELEIADIDNVSSAKISFIYNGVERSAEYQLPAQLDVYNHATDIVEFNPFVNDISYQWSQGKPNEISAGRQISYENGQYCSADFADTITDNYSSYTIEPRLFSGDCRSPTPGETRIIRTVANLAQKEQLKAVEENFSDLEFTYQSLYTWDIETTHVAIE